MSAARPKPEWDALFSALFDGSLSAEDHRRLDSLLRSEEQARREYLELIEMHAMLRRQLGAVGELELPDRAMNEPPAPELARDRRSWYGALRTLSRDYTALSLLVSALTLAVVLLSLALFVPQWKVPQWNGFAAREAVERPRVVAHVTATHQATWHEESDANFRNTHLLADDDLRLASGWVEVTLTNGAVVLLEGPASLTVIGDEAVRLHDGKLTARVDRPQTEEFTVHTPQSTITDRGTAFGVAVDEGLGTHIEVTEGAVEVAWGAGGKRQLRPGESLQIDLSGRAADERPRGAQPPRFAWTMPADPMPELLLHWTCDTFDAEGHLPDASGNGRSGRIDAVGGRPRLVEGPAGLGQALEFNGRRQRILLPTADAHGLDRPFEAVTIAAWIRPKEGSRGYFLGKMGEKGDRGWQLHYDQGAIGLIFFATADDGRLALKSPMGAASGDGFMHVALTLEAGRFARLYVDGRLVAQTPRPAAMNWANTAEFCVGHRGDTLPNEYFAGAIDDVRVYGQALSAQQIAELFEGGNLGKSPE